MSETITMTSIERVVNKIKFVYIFILMYKNIYKLYILITTSTVRDLLIFTRAQQKLISYICSAEKMLIASNILSACPGMFIPGGNGTL